jgi:CDP-glycerol glycerophosphotransferase
MADEPAGTSAGDPGGAALVAKVSVVVPFHNVDRYIEAALESIGRQTFRDLEVIMVDDGSTDSSTVVAKDYAARDPRFQLIQQRQQGPGIARNTGVRKATGTYLAFVDSDDLVDRHAYELLVGSLEETGSDIACGGVSRISSQGVRPSVLHSEPFGKTALRTHVSRLPALLTDRTCWNKVFRRSFWDAHGLEFAGCLYEDPPVMVRAHVLASSVDVFRDVVYYWRERDEGTLSITQRSRELQNVEQRMAAMGNIASFLEASAPALKPIFDRSVLRSDFPLLASAYGFANDAHRERLTELATDYLRHVGDSGYLGVPALSRLHCHLLSRGMMSEYLEVLRFSGRGDSLAIPAVPSSDKPGRWCAAYPFFRDPARGIPDHVFDITAEMTLNAVLDAVTWRGARLRLEGYAYIRRLDSPTESDSQIRVMLRNSRTRRAIRLRVERVFRPDVTALSGQSAACYDWSGFAVEIDPRRLATLPGLWRAANWELTVEVRGGGLVLSGPTSMVTSGSAQWPMGRWITEGVWVQPAPEQDGRFVIQGRQVTAFVTGCHASTDTFDIEGWTRFPLRAGATLVLSPSKGGGKAIRVPAEATGPWTGADERDRGRRRTAFRARVPVGKLVSLADPASPIAKITHVYDEFTWDVSINPGGGGATTRLAMAPETAGSRLSHGAREVTAFVTHFGYLSMLERTLRPVITAFDWTAAQCLRLRGDYTDPGARPAELILRHGESGQQHRLPLTWEGDTFATELAPDAMPGRADCPPLASGKWRLLGAAGHGEITIAVARRLLAGLPGYQRTGLHEVELQPYRTDALRLDVRPAFTDDERGRYALRRLVARDYPKAVRQPLRDLAVFDSFTARACSDNPLAIYAELRRTRPELDCAWISEAGDFTVPDGGRVMLANSREHFEALAQARYVIFNDMLPRWFTERDGQTCLQTWHGTPLKRIGLDVDRPQFTSGIFYPDLLRADVAHWDLLLSPNSFSTPIFRHAFGFQGEILECGYPRNDALHRPGQAERRAAILNRMGLPADKRIVLYVPTWRDDAAADRGRYRFELELDLEAAAAALSSDHVLLIRLHTQMRNSLPDRAADGFAVNVTRYPDVTDLYLISDVLLTDYSSAMFDFAGTGRPMIFFTYDLDRYRDRLRGFYFDFEATAPGPLLATSAEVIAALRDIAAVERSYRAAYSTFVTRYCSLDDGHAAERVVRRLLAGS